jgi:riboflavin kinase / FMN adenylyltransferase
MQVEEELKRFAPQRDTVLTIGVFDGVHLGHQRLIDYLKRQALPGDKLPGVVTFRTHPRLVINSATTLHFLTSLEERIRLLEGLGVELVVPLTFDREVASLTAREFTTLLQQHLRMRGLVVGPDFALGRKREGDASALHKIGKESGFWVEVVSPGMANGEVISSTAIRQALSRGDMAKVNRLLGRSFSLAGKVVHGDERGKQLGFPTANVEMSAQQAIPGDGVYVARTHLGARAYPSVTNIGKRPTFGKGERTVEVHLIGFSGLAYGEDIRVEIVERLRPERHFPTPEDLKQQISRDVEAAVSILDKVPK